MPMRVVPVPGPGAEDVVVGRSGRHEGAVFTGTEDGRIWRVSPDGRQVDRVAETGGRPLGIEMTQDGRLVVCDARRGLLAVDPAHGGVEVLVGEVDGRPLLFCNNAALAADGTVYFSDSSRVHPIDAWKAEMVEVTRTGRLLRATPDGSPSVLVDGLAFANGVALGADDEFVVVAETAARNLQRYWLTGPRTGTLEAFVRDLPGYPDNIARGSDGLIWVTIASPRDPVVETLQRGPMWVRRGATRIPQSLQPAPKRTIRVQAYDDGGTRVRDVVLDDPADTSRYHMVTGVREHDGRIWMGSLHEPAVAVLDP